MISKTTLARKRLLVVGDSMLDRYWFGDTNRISPEAPVPVVRIVKNEDRLGGAANVALNIAELGASATLMSVIGNDDAGKSLQSLLAAAHIDDLSAVIDPKGSDYSRYRGATLITPNRAELALVVGNWATEAELIEKAQNLRRELDLTALLLTRSEEGMTLFTDKGEFNVPAQAREVFDVSGAGDTSIAVTAAMIAAGLDLKEAVRIANQAGGIVVGKLGTASVTYEELFGKGN